MKCGTSREQREDHLSGMASAVIENEGSELYLEASLVSRWLYLEQPIQIVPTETINHIRTTTLGFMTMWVKELDDQLELEILAEWLVYLIARLP